MYHKEGYKNRGRMRVKEEVERSRDQVVVERNGKFLLFWQWRGRRKVEVVYNRKIGKWKG